MVTAPADLFEDLGHSLSTDYFFLREQLTEQQLEVLRRVRLFVDDEVLPVIGGYWERAEMPWPLIRRLGELGIVGEDIQGYGCPGFDPISLGLIHMELNRGDGSLGTVPRGPGGPGDEVDRDARLRGAEAALAAADGQARAVRRVRADRAESRVGFGRARDERAPGRRHVRVERRQALDRRGQLRGRRRRVGA